MAYQNQFYMPGQPNQPQMVQGYPQMAQQQQQGQVQQQPGQQPPQPFNLAALQQAQLASRTGTPPQPINQVQALLAAQGQMGMGGMNQMGQMPQQQNLNQAGGGGQINIAAFQQLLNSGQMTREQFNLLAQQIQTQQIIKQQQQQQQQHQQHQHAAQVAAQAAVVSAQNQPQARPPSQPSYPSHPPAPPQNNQQQEQRVPYQHLQQHMQQLTSVRALNAKIQLLSQALQTGMISTAAAGVPGQGKDSQIPLSPQLRQAVERQVEDTKRQINVMMSNITAFQNLYSTQKITADWTFYQRTGQQLQQQQHQQMQNQQMQNQQQQQPPRAPSAQGVPQNQNNFNPGFRPPQNAQPAQQQQNQPMTSQQLLQQARAVSAAAAAAAKPLPPTQSQPPSQPFSSVVPQLVPPQPQSYPPSQPPPQTQQQSPFQPQNPVPNAVPPQQPNQVPGLAQPAQLQQLSMLQSQLNPQLFMKSLFELMRNRGEPIESAPYVEGREIDLYQLYQAVSQGGGSQNVTASQTWHHIAAKLSLPVDASAPNLVSAPQDTQRISFELARVHQKLLRPFEEAWQKNLLSQQQRIMESQRKAQQDAQQNASARFGIGRNGQSDNPSHFPVAAGQSMPQPSIPPPSRPQAPPLVPVPAGQPMPQSTNPPPARPPSVQAQQPPRQSTPSMTPQQQAAALAKQNGTSNGESTPALPPNINTNPSQEQIQRAKGIVQAIRNEIESTRPKLKILNVADNQKQGVTELTRQLIPHVGRVVETLPLFLAMTSDQTAVKKLLTFAALFNDQLRVIGSGQFVLDLAGLTSLRDQFQRCWMYIRANAAQRASGKAAAQPATSTAPPNQQRPAQANQASPKDDQFSMMAQKNSLRVEDLRPPPMKHRRTASGATTGSPANTASPTTPATIGTSPQPNLAKLTKPSPVRGKGSKKELNGASPAATLAALREELKTTSSPSPRTVQAPPAPPEESLSLKRKREEDEAEQDPNAFIEKMLKTLNGLDSTSSASLTPLSLDLGSQLGSHPTSDSLIPPIVPPNPSAQPPSFTVLASSIPSSTSNTLSNSQIPRDSAASDAFDFDFFVDSSAAGFDISDDSTLTAETPELVGGGGGGAGETPASPKFDAEPDFVKKPLSSPTKAQDEWYSSNGLVTELAFNPSLDWDINDPLSTPSWAM